MDDLAKKLNIADFEGWYKIKIKTLEEHGGAALLKKYSVVSKLLTAVYPEYQKACRESVMKLVNNLKLSKVEDLLNVPHEYPIIILQLMKWVDIFLFVLQKLLNWLVNLIIFATQRNKSTHFITKLRLSFEQLRTIRWNSWFLQLHLSSRPTVDSTTRFFHHQSYAMILVLIV